MFGQSIRFGSSFDLVRAHRLIAVGDSNDINTNNNPPLWALCGKGELSESACYWQLSGLAPPMKSNSSNLDLTIKREKSSRIPVGNEAPLIQE